MSNIIKFTIPQVFFEEREVEVPDDFELDQVAWEHRIDFIYEHLTELDKQWLASPVPEKDHKRTIEHAMDAEYSYIKESEPAA